MSKVYLDFEFNRTVEKNVNLVCCCTETDSGEQIKWWLHNDLETQKELSEYLDGFDEVVAYAAVAEARSYLALGKDPLKFKWVDLFLEYRCLTNHNDELQWGKQLVNGKVKRVSKPKPKWQRTEDDNRTGFIATHSLSEAAYKLLGKIIDTEHKTKMRDLIISDPEEFSDEECEDILEYCMSDVIFLNRMWKKCIEHFLTLDTELDEVDCHDHAYVRGRYAAHTAIMESDGYPIDYKKVKNFSNQVGNIMFDLQREINGLFPDIQPFRWNRLQNRFSENQKNIKQWIEENCNVGRWQKTDKGALSLAQEAWTKQFSFSHTYPEDNFGAQMIRYGRLKQSLYGFNASPGGKRKNFWDSVGSDKRVRPYMNIYKAQSSRSQPAASGFMFLKPAWMRALVLPEEGKFMAGIDYGSQEFFISALEADDKNMIEAYLTGDPYIAFAKLSGQMPEDGKREDYEDVRTSCKSTVLGISYLMTKVGLAVKLTNDTGKVWTEDDAQDQIDLFYDAFSDLADYQTGLIEDYRVDGLLNLDCGWYLWGDNENHRSVANMRIQGQGATIMRKAVDLAVARGVSISFTLHDALYMEDYIGQEHKIKILHECMREAFVHYYIERGYEKEAAGIKLDPFAWSREYKRDSSMEVKGLKVPCSNLYIDSRSLLDYEKFSPYFEDRAEDVL